MGICVHENLKSLSLSFRAVVLAFAVAAVQYGQALASVSDASALDGPGWKMLTCPPVEPDTAREILSRPAELTTSPLPQSSAVMAEGAGSVVLAGGPASSETQSTSEIQALARALQHDPKLIFDYVHNHIDHVPMFGSLNGATGALLAGRGTDLDQASLFIALMRASGYSANYASQDVGYTVERAANWLGVEEDAGVVMGVFGNGGIPGGVFQHECIIRVCTTMCH